ncbi:hypothetical protein GCM10010909_25240 [Acidocella aquatica]|uniref:Uncharacterized protein n=1 Tax=Acidocella aquatica TaxID=1922313 RepID=A0ABQ6A956_9PROT|nr:hypothetical protein [Acidocella aquatica]GLR67843.1 hypothetical protein GCM10010909_25240 [Acidocella aquatica]
MPTVYETKAIRKTFVWARSNVQTNLLKSFERGYLAPSPESVDRAITEITAELSLSGWEVRGILRLEGSEYYWNHEGRSQTHDGVVKSYSAAYTAGVVVMCQRAIEITEEELEGRKKAPEYHQAAAAAANTSGAAAAAEVRLELIEPFKKGVFSKVWMFDGQEYPDEDAARTAREKKAKAAERALIRA